MGKPHLSRRSFNGLAAGMAALTWRPGLGIAAEEERSPEPRAISNFRLSEEAGEIKKAGARESFFKLGEVVEKLRTQGVLFAPGLGRTASSHAANLLGLTSIDPYDVDLEFDAVVPGRKGAFLSLAIGMEPAAIPKLLESLKVRAEGDSWLPGLLHVELPGLFLCLEGIQVHRVPASAGVDVARPFVIERGLRRWLDLLRPQGIPDLAFALAMYRPGLSWVGRAVDILRDRKAGWRLFREDAIREIRDLSWVSRLDAARYVSAAGRKIPEETRCVREELLRTAAAKGRSTQELESFLDQVDGVAGTLASRAHYTAEAVNLSSRIEAVSQWSFSRLTSLSPAWEGEPWEAELFRALDEVE